MPEGLHYALAAEDGQARAGTLHTLRGPVPTPTFMPVGTRGSVKALTPRQVAATGAGIVLGNAYHLSLRPGTPLIAELGGLHAFTGWEGPMLTDSGGFQVFSLAGLRKVSEQGVAFRDPRSGEKRMFTPESSMREQEELGADIIMAFDECPEGPCDRERARAAMERSLRWLARCVAAKKRSDCALFGIVQGAGFEDLRRESLERTLAHDLPGYAFGGFSVGEPKEVMQALLPALAPELPADKPRYLMGVGKPEDLVLGVQAGIDMFDCVMPTRNARNASLFTRWGTLRIRNARFRRDPRPVEPDCPCLACAGGFSRAFLRHLCDEKEILFLTLATSHNLTYYQELMRGLRAAILEGRLESWVKGLQAGWKEGVPA